MTRGQQATRGDGLVRWLLPASLLHAAVVLLAAALSPWSTPTAARVASAPGSLEEPESNVELSLWEGDEWSRLARSEPAAVARVETALRASDPQPRAAVAIDISQADAPRGGTPSVPEHEAAPPASAAGNAAQPEASPRLSLDQLGIGTNPFMAIAVEPLSELERASARLQAALHPLQAHHDRQSRLGPEGPVVNAARQLVLADDVLLETSAILDVRVDAGGRVTEVHLIQASNQNKAWQLIAARLAKALQPLTLRRAESKQGWGMKLRLASSVQLPSGAAPGLRMGVLGQQVAGNGGPNSTSLELSPTSKLDIEEPIDSSGRHLDQPLRLEAMLLKLKADLADIGAPARRVVEVAVLSIEAPAAP